MKRRNRDEIVRDALEEIHPLASKKSECEDMILTYLRLLYFIQMTKGPSVKTFKEQLNRFTKVLKKVETIARSFRHHRRWREFQKMGKKPVDYDTFMAEVARLIETAEFFADHLVVKHGAKPIDPMKENAAEYAVTLIKLYGSGRTSKARLASILYEGPTGIKDADLEKQCAKFSRTTARKLAS
jgi:hypothetical protein